MNVASDSRSKVGVIGLGLLGTALAERLLSAGFDTIVYNRTKDKADALLNAGAAWSDNPLLECDRVVICLYTTETVEAVLEQMDAGLRRGLTVIDTTTGDPSQTASLGARLAERNVDYLESPIAASSAQTREGQAVAFVAGSEAVYDACQDIYAALAPRSFFVGPWGCAANMKLANNLVLGLNRVALAEGLLFAKAVGLDPAQTLDVLSQGNAYSVAMDVKGKKMIEGDFSTQGRLTQHLKDVHLILKEAQRNGLSLPGSQLHEKLLRRAEDLGLGENDNSAIIKAIEQFGNESPSANLDLS